VETIDMTLWPSVFVVKQVTCYFRKENKTRIINYYKRWATKNLLNFYPQRNAFQ